MEEFCKHCPVCCCYIYRKCKDVKKIQQILFDGDLDQFGVEPLERIGDKCEFLGKNGCIINRNKRPKPCLEYECSLLKEYKKGNMKIIEKLKKMKPY